ncbi:hypothetical protein EVAR_76600_1 [Eumeta japonica]|uniref:Uncharacterized protein n=1 Tax=Eumeta variegata TaxID=151549 RepID=A0A4C1T5Z4_EUMVA|nr:hypothetical protein EVAR_76600_1 [Eumeta japonica]
MQATREFVIIVADAYLQPIITPQMNHQRVVDLFSLNRTSNGRLTGFWEGDNVRICSGFLHIGIVINNGIGIIDEEELSTGTGIEMDNGTRGETETGSKIMIKNVIGIVIRKLKECLAKRAESGGAGPRDTLTHEYESLQLRTTSIKYRDSFTGKLDPYDIVTVSWMSTA